METRAESFSTPAKPSRSHTISKVKVIVRVRPFLPQEISERNGNPKSCVSVLDSEVDATEEVTVLLKDQGSSRNECYKLDSYFGQEGDNVSQIFEKEVRPLIPGIFHGFNATVFAYGATGSGKTYTMQGTDVQPGLMPMSMKTILPMCQTAGTTVEISYYEVYVDRCYDLLEPKEKEISVWDDEDGEVHLKGLSRVQINSMSEFHEVFTCAIKRRKVAHTSLNDVSSRSHGVLVISVSTGNIVGKLNLIDLAGNEDNRRTCNEGIRLQESSKINQSLFALSNVIYALNNNKSRVPYRDSKLTRILQDSLGGTSRALMVACLNPGEYQQSVHTVSLAARSRHVSNFVYSTQKQENSSMKVDMEAKLRAWLESKGKIKSAQKTPYSRSSLKKPNACLSFTKRKINTNNNEGDMSLKEGDRARCNLFNNVDFVDPAMEIMDHAAEENKKEEFKISTEGIVLESNISTQADQKKTTINSDNCIGSSPMNVKKKEIDSSPRKVLSPINSNVPVENMAFGEQLYAVVPDPKTPKTTPFPRGTANDMFQTTGTPLDKFNSRSSNLKTTLVGEYVDLLNSATRDELLELKGIGQKLADYILELRQTSPLKTLSDLEKIGLSSKQVYNLFGKTARQLLD